MLRADFTDLYHLHPISIADEFTEFIGHFVDQGFVLAFYHDPDDRFGARRADQDTAGGVEFFLELSLGGGEMRDFGDAQPGAVRTFFRTWG